MGFNSVLFVPNDQLDAIASHPESFATEVVRAMGSCTTGKLPHRFNGFSVPHIGHMDEVALIAAGGNYATKLVSHHWTHRHDTEEGQVALLKALAKTLGYSVRKNPQKKG